MPDALTRLATCDDLAELTLLMQAAIDELQAPFLTPEEIVASRAVMGLDTQLVDDGTYFAVESDGRIVGCGGWQSARTSRAALSGEAPSRRRAASVLDTRPRGPRMAPSEPAPAGTMPAPAPGDRPHGHSHRTPSTRSCPRRSSSPSACSTCW